MSTGSGHGEERGGGKLGKWISVLEDQKRQLQSFQRLLEFHQKRARKLDWDTISPVPWDSIATYGALRVPAFEEKGALFSRVAVIKLNGGLGTTMGCEGPKSLIPIRKDRTFLEETLAALAHVQTKYGVSIPLFLMNSFWTDRATQDSLGNLRRNETYTSLDVTCFLQSKYPRLWKDSYEPVPSDPWDETGWYPPGHAEALQGMKPYLDSLERRGIRYLFFSNIDNLGATPSGRILAFLISKKIGTMMEVTERTRQDQKGGCLGKLSSSRYKLLEISQIPEDKKKCFEKLRLFNTNNLWLSIPALRKFLETHDDDLDVLVNEKTLEGKKVLQLERSLGSSLEFFDPAHLLSVPRTRFLPVKSLEDLFLLQSNLYRRKSKTSPKWVFSGRRKSLPWVVFHDSFRNWKDYARRVIPPLDLESLESLEIGKNDSVVLDARTPLIGTVIL